MCFAMSIITGMCLKDQLGKVCFNRAKVNLRGLCYYDSGSRNFYTKDRPIRSPEDLEGLKIRVMNSKTAMDMVSGYGRCTNSNRLGELYSSLAQGTVDGAENIRRVTSNKH